MVSIAVFFVAWSTSAFAIALFHSATAFCAFASDSIRFDPVIPSVMVLILFSISRFFASHVAYYIKYNIVTLTWKEARRMSIFKNLKL